MHIYIPAYTYTLHEDVSHTKTSQPTLNELQAYHSMLYSLCCMDVSPTRLHVTKPRNTWTDPHPCLFRHCLWQYNQNQESKEHVYVHFWKVGNAISSNSHHPHSACAHVFLLYKQFTFTNQLNYW